MCQLLLPLSFCSLPLFPSFAITHSLSSFFNPLFFSVANLLSYALLIPSISNYLSMSFFSPSLHSWTLVVLLGGHATLVNHSNRPYHGSWRWLMRPPDSAGRSSSAPQDTNWRTAVTRHPSPTMRAFTSSPSSVTPTFSAGTTLGILSTCLYRG